MVASDFGLGDGGSSEDLQLAMLGSEYVQVLVCGQLIQIRRDEAKASIERLQEAVQRAVGMESHSFCFWDANGRELPNDYEICDSIDRGSTPIQATLVGHAVHDIELKREELAQMQWKVMRDQFSALSIQLQAVRRQSDACYEQMKQQRQEHAKTQQILLHEFQGQIEDLTNLVKSCVGMDSLVGLTDRVHAVSQLVSAEANARESAVRGLEFKIEKLFANQEGERASRVNDVNAVHKALDRVKGSWEDRLDAEVSERKTSVDKVIRDAQQLHEKVGVLAFQQAQDMQHLQQQAAEMQDMATTTLRDTRSEVLSLTSTEAGSLVSELSRRVVDLEENLAAEQNKSSENASCWIERHEHLQEQFDKAFQTIEQCRLQGRSLTGVSKAVQDKSDHTAEGLLSLGEATREGHRRERQARDEQIRSLQRTLLGQQQAALCELEARIAARVEREAAARAQSMLQLLDDMGNMLEKEIPSTARQEALRELKSRSREANQQVRVVEPQGPQFAGAIGIRGEAPLFRAEVTLGSPIAAASSLQPQVSVQKGSGPLVRSSSTGSIAARKPLSARPNMLAASSDASTVSTIGSASHMGHARQLCQPTLAFASRHV